METYVGFRKDELYGFRIHQLKEYLLKVEEFSDTLYGAFSADVHPQLVAREIHRQSEIKGIEAKIIADITQSDRNSNTLYIKPENLGVVIIDHSIELDETNVEKRGEIYLLRISGILERLPNFVDHGVLKKEETIESKQATKILRIEEYRQH